jgi:hypothetical protein
MIKLASSSSISLIDAGYRGATAYFELVVCAAIVLKNAGSNVFASTQARKNLPEQLDTSALRTPGPQASTDR